MDENRQSLASSFLSFALAILAILTLRWLLVEPYVIPSGSMIPTLLIHDHILVNKLAYGVRVPFTDRWLLKRDSPKRGEVVVFRFKEPYAPNSSEYFMIKRVIGIGGDKVEYSSDGELIINGEPVPRTALPSPENGDQAPYYPATPADLGGPFDVFRFYEETLDAGSYRVMFMKQSYRWSDRPFIVPDGHLFLMGDSRDNSKDSRAWGSWPEDKLLGRAMFVWLSCEETLPFLPFLCHPLKLRWNRFFHGIE